MSLLTVILNWRTPQMSLAAAQSAREAMIGIEGAISIVDNDSADGSYEIILAAVKKRGWDRPDSAGRPAVQVLQSGWNGGFGAGNNYGIRAGLPNGERPEFVYILNSDAFVEKNAIAALLNHLKCSPKTGLAGSYLYGESGKPHGAAFRFPSIAGEFESHLRLGLVTKLLSNFVVAHVGPFETMSADWLSGASLMIRYKALEDIGLFDERFFLYFEETDLCKRAERAGWQRDFVIESRVMHLGSVSTGMRNWARIPEYWLHSRLHYFYKNHGLAYTVAASFSAFSAALLWRLRLLVQSKPRQDPDHYLKDLVRHHCKFRFGHKKCDYDGRVNRKIGRGAEQHEL